MVDIVTREEFRDALGKLENSLIDTVSIAVTDALSHKANKHNKASKANKATKAAKAQGRTVGNAKTTKVLATHKATDVGANMLMAHHGNGQTIISYDSEAFLKPYPGSSTTPYPKDSRLVATSGLGGSRSVTYDNEETGMTEMITFRVVAWPIGNEWPPKPPRR